MIFTAPRRRGMMICGRTTMDNEKIIRSVKNCFNWLEDYMLTFGRGAWGVYERIRTDINMRVGYSRPDTATEFLRAARLYKTKLRDSRYDDVYENLVKWLAFAQNKTETEGNEAFPFYLADGCKDWKVMQMLFQNDNGKIMLNLALLYMETKDERLLAMAEKCAAFWLSVQRENGTFYDACLNIGEPDSAGACFVLWPMAAMFALFKATGKESYRRSGEKAFAYMQTQQKDGRIFTSYERTKTEAWRPVSSEQYIALLCYAISFNLLGDERFLTEARKLLLYSETLIDAETGAIKNCVERDQALSLNDDPALCDLVYTQGFALNAFVELYRAAKEEKFLVRAQKLAGFLADIQCKDDLPCVNGGWRGSYNLKTGRYDGRCNQLNALDEGGEYSVYAGWCALPIAFGMLKLL